MDFTAHMSQPLHASAYMYNKGLLLRPALAALYK